jgi:hypothetical protein
MNSSPRVETNESPGEAAPSWLLRLFDEPDGGWLGCIGGAVVFVFPLVLYLITAMRIPALNGDYAEFGVMGVVWGIPHPTGFPLYLILNGLVSLLPIGTHAFRIAALSAVLVSIANNLAYRICRSCGFQPLLSLGIVLLIATGQAIWLQGIIPEVYGLHVLLMVASVWALFKWEDTGDDRWLWLAIWIFIVGLGNHPGGLFALPGLLIFPLLHKPRVFLSGRTWLNVLGASIVLLLLYGYILVRSTQNPPIAEEQINGDFGRFVYYVTGQEYKSNMETYKLAGRLYIIKQSAAFALATLTIPGFILAVLGVVPAFIKARKRMLTLVLIPVGFFISIMIFPAVEPGSYLAPGFVFAGILLGYFVMWCVDGADKVFKKGESARSGHSNVVMVIALVLILAGIVAHVHVNIHALDFSGPSREYERGSRITRAVESDSLVFTPVYRLTMMMEYAKFADRVRGDDTSVTCTQVWNSEKAQEAIDDGRHVYVYSELVDQVGEFMIIPVPTGTAEPELYELLPRESH